MEEATIPYDITEEISLWFKGEMIVGFECRKCHRPLTIDFYKKIKCECGVSYSFLPKIIETT